ncbi:MAG: hypothetical protein QW692_05585 [Nitrososphaerota archaeon]
MVAMVSIQTRLEDFSREKAMPRDDREAISRIRARHVARMSEAFAAALLAAMEKAEVRSRC